jgi:hypothetical protein
VVDGAVLSMPSDCSFHRDPKRTETRSEKDRKIDSEFWFQATPLMVMMTVRWK